MSDYVLTVGLEIHAELKTRTKMFCDSPNDTNETRPNTNICPVCLGHPGTLPVINREAVRSIVRLGTAVGGKIADYTEFDRKNYFYPDIPKGYQISQYKFPLVKGGALAGVKLTRIHLEEDTARSIHAGDGGSLLDFNRSGVPLVELVTEPVIHDTETAARFAKEFQLLISPTYLGISSADMEKGEMRVEANISVSKGGKLGTKVEVKNLNSFKSVEKAIRFEAERQAEALEKGETVIQETRGWDEVKEGTFSQRAKESAHDYRYFPDPDLAKLFVDEVQEFGEKEIKKSLPELPWQKRERLSNSGIPKEQIEIYVQDKSRGEVFKQLESQNPTAEVIRVASNYLSNVPGVERVKPSSILGTAQLVVDNTISSTSAKIIFTQLENSDRDPLTVAKEIGLVQISDRKILEEIVKEVLNTEDKNAPVAFLIGQAMKKSGGRANPQILKEIFTKLL
ncbi:MAG: Asp-tRNA(Asn)/Glu-tRNA(Gln) amidotransferase subunit GatB [Minisyncoccia bacterium]